MDQAEPRRRVDDEKDQREYGNAVAATVEQTADILKLDIDCCEEAFDYLPLEDLVSVGKTCKRLQQVAGYCFQQNYPNCSVLCRSEGLARGLKMPFPFQYHGDLGHFAPFIWKVFMTDWDLQYFIEMQSKFRRLKHIRIHGNIEGGVTSLRPIHMNRLEDLCLDCCVLDSNFHEIIDSCASLKRLSILRCASDLKWLDRKYPTLEYFHYSSRSECDRDIVSNEEIPKFLELNPNIRTFTASPKWLLKNSDHIMRANIALDVLDTKYSFRDDYDFDSMINLLKKLHEHGFYRKLHYGSSSLNQIKLDQLATLKGLALLHGADSEEPLTFPELKNIEELHLRDPINIRDLKMLPKNLINLKCISFYIANIDDIMPFIRQSVEMEKIYIFHIESLVAVQGMIIDLLALNREREKLPDAQKITLYVQDKDYLATKWAMKVTDFGLIRLKRRVSYSCIQNNYLG